MRLHVLDLFSCAGGAAMGYHRAGFTVDGCDIADRPRYPFAYHRGDALDYLAHLITTGDIERYTLVHASPPCQAGCALTVGTNASQGWGASHVDLVAATRDLLNATGRPYVIEQPNGRAEIRKDLTLCGEMFGLGVLRHRNFELGRWATAQPAHPRHRGYVRGHRHGVHRNGPYVAAYGNGGGKATVPEMQQAMGITWTDVREELTDPARLHPVDRTRLPDRPAGGVRVTDSATLAGLDPITLGDLLRVAGPDGFDRWQDQIRRTGGCSDPIHLTGWTIHKDKTTGQTLHHYSTENEPGGRLLVACGNRRASRCPSCAWTYAGDTYHLIRAGLAGDDRRDIPATVRDHPRVFATITAPSFGPVHNRPDRGPCRCGTRPTSDAPELGTALDPDSYDYAGAVLFNNHAGQLWQRFTNRLRREIAARAGLTQRELKECARLSYGKVAEFQKRGAVHFHAVIRLDGPDGPGTPPPSWATVGLLSEAIRAAAGHSYTSVSVPAADGQPARTFRWGTQRDVRPVKAFGDGSDITEQAVASYVAKYATKAAENTGTFDRRIGELSELDRHGVPDHARRLIAACKILDPLYPDRRLWAWAHMLGFRGHFSSKSRRYSTTLGALRQARADYRAAQEHAALGLEDAEPDTVLVLTDWQYAGHGHTPGESVLAATIARDLQLNRETAREELAALEGA